MTTTTTTAISPRLVNLIGAVKAHISTKDFTQKGWAYLAQLTEEQLAASILHWKSRTKGGAIASAEALVDSLNKGKQDLEYRGYYPEFENAAPEQEKEQAKPSKKKPSSKKKRSVAVA